MFKKPNLKYNDPVINNIVQTVEHQLDYVPVYTYVCEPDPDINPDSNPHTKYYITSLTDITDFVSGEYYDYLSSIPTSIWKKYKTQARNKFKDLEITTIPVLDLFVEKLNIEQEFLFQMVKTCQSNHKLSLCIMIRYYKDFIKSFVGTNIDKDFFTKSLHENNLPLNKYIYYNIYCVLETKFDVCPYKKIFGSIGKNSHYLYIKYFEVFEYFVELFGISLSKKLSCNSILNYVDILYGSYYGGDYCVGTFSVKPFDAFKRLVTMGSIAIDKMRCAVMESIEDEYGDEYGDSISGERRQVGISYADSIVEIIIEYELIDDLIGLLNYLDIDLKQFNGRIINYMLVNILFSNNMDFIIRFFRYLKWDVGYVMETDFYSRLIELLKMKRGGYVHLYVNGHSLNTNVKAGLHELLRGSRMLSMGVGNG